MQNINEILSKWWLIVSQKGLFHHCCWPSPDYLDYIGYASFQDWADVLDINWILYTAITSVINKMLIKSYENDNKLVGYIFSFRLWIKLTYLLISVNVTFGYSLDGLGRLDVTLRRNNFFINCCWGQQFIFLADNSSSVKRFFLC